MAGSTFTFVMGVITILTLVILWIGFNSGIQSVGDSLITVANNANSTTNITIAQSVMSYSILIIIIIITAVMVKTALEGRDDI